MIQTNCFKYMRVKYIFFFHFKEIVIYRPITVNTPYFKFAFKTLHVICTPGQSNLPSSISRECLKLSLSWEGDMIFNMHNILSIVQKVRNSKMQIFRGKQVFMFIFKFGSVKLRHKTRFYKDA